MPVETSLRSSGTVHGGRSLPWLTVAALTSLCLLYGISAQRHVLVPPDIDSLRDLGFIQALLDGNYWQDPSYAGAWRYYPPLVHVIVAIAAHVLGVSDLALFWTRSGIWLNLMTPVAFFLMCRGLFANSPAAAAATCFYVLWSGSRLWPWVTGGYTPWPLTPLIAQTLFFVSVLAIVTSRPPSLKLSSLLCAALIGLLIGLTALAHLVPAVILTAIVTVAAVVRAQCDPRIIIWLGVVGIVELATAAPYLVPAILFYPQGILNEVYSGWVDNTLMLSNMESALISNAPGVLALLATVILVRRRRDLRQVSIAALLAWIAVCSLFILRHYLCALPATGQASACHVFVLTVHHYQLYLQNAWSCLMGYAAWAAYQEAARPGHARWCRPAAVTIVFAALAVGMWSFLHREYDESALQYKFDREAYRWVLANTRPSNIFVTDDNSGWAAIAAGRRMVAIPALFSNPFVDWTARDERRRAYLDAASRDGDGDRRLCDFENQEAYLLVPHSFQVRSSRVRVVYVSTIHTVYRISTEDCKPST